MSQEVSSESQSTEKRRMHKERLGTVVAANSAKTLKVAVTRRVKHGRYPKFVTRRKIYAVHDEVGCKVGDQVRIRETRPLSKTKRWRVVRVEK